ncbi:MAG: phosphoenolpyruvate carboxykinase (ATP) [Nannocystaceae bacterium]
MTEDQASLPSQPALAFNVEVLANPSQETLRELALEHTPHCFVTAHGSVNKVARNKARMAAFTYIIDRKGDGKQAYSHNVIEPAKAEALIAAQTQYLEAKGKLIEIDGYVGMGPRAVPVQWLYTLEGANIAGMQQVLAFPRESVEDEETLARPFAPAFRLVYTPDFRPADMPGQQAIVVDLDNYVTYIMGPDYFGESKKGALRMLCEFIYRRGGLVMHAGAKTIDTGSDNLVMAVLGLSGTGKTTTTFSQQGRLTQPVQDDMVALWPAGEISITENGCFAKTFGLTAESEPVIHAGTCSRSAWIENCFVDADGIPVFDKGLLTSADVTRLREVLIDTGANAENVDAYIRGDVTAEEITDANGIPKDGWDFAAWSENGRSIIPMSSVEGAADFRSLPQMRSLGILNRDEGADAATPGILRFSSPEQAAGYLMLGETSKTSAAGKDRGKTRSPFTQPFFPLAHNLQAERFSELAATFAETNMWMMNTGYVAGDGRSVKSGDGLKIKIPHSSAMLEAMISGTIKWTKDPDFGYEVVDIEAEENKELLNRVPAEILQPRRLFEAKGALGSYQAWVQRMKEERSMFLRKFDVPETIISAVTGPQ